jgi:Domain of unknown function (DUF4375)
MNRDNFASMMGVPAELSERGRHRLSRAAIVETPYIRWNAFIDIISAGPDAFEPGMRRHAALAFLYESEVQNGGHDQYFSNSGGTYAQDTIVALKELGGICHSKVLADALAVSDYGHSEVPDKRDAAFHRCNPDLCGVLQRHLDTHESLYIEWAP